MSKHDSTTSANTKFSINPHDYFVPLIVIVVLCILIVATFHGYEPDRQLADVADTDQVRKPAADATAVAAIDLKVSETADASVKTMNTTATANQIIPDDQTEATETADDEDTADADLMSPAHNLTTAGIGASVANPANNTTSTDKLAADEDASPSAEPVDGKSRGHAASVDKPQDTIPRWNQRRRLHQEASQAQKVHMMKMLEYRAEVMKRIEQDRRDLYRHRHNTEQQRRQHRDRYRQRLEQARNGTGDIPI
jgi:hypothetical protein